MAKAKKTNKKRGEGLSVKNRPVVKGVKNANQWVLDPRQTEFARYYTDPKSPTFANAYQTALKVGYGEDYARTIISVGSQWVKEIIRAPRHTRMLEKAERNLEETLALETKLKIVEDGEVIAEVTDPKLLKIKTDVSMFVAERLDKDTYSTKTVEDKTITVDITKTLDDIANANRQKVDGQIVETTEPLSGGEQKGEIGSDDIERSSKANPLWQALT